MQTIDLISFLQNYYGIFHEKLTFDKLTHEVVGKLFPFVKACKKGYLNLEDLKCGNVIGVYDKYKRVMFYYNPHLYLDKMNVSEGKEESVKEEKFISLENLDNLSKDELLKIRRDLRLSNHRKESFLINKFIKRLKEKEPRYYRERREKILIKESLNYYD